MNDTYVITISRQFGSLGRSIARRTAELLDIDFMDRDIVEATAKRMNLAIPTIGDSEEQAKNPFFYRQFPLGIAPLPIEDDIFAVQKQIILDTAYSRSCIIVGRCAEAILREHPKHVNIYIQAPVEARTRNCIERLGMDEKTALKMIKSVDAARENYRKRYVSKDVGAFTDRDIVIDSSVFGVEGAAQIIANIAKTLWPEIASPVEDGGQT